MSEHNSSTAVAEQAVAEQKEDKAMKWSPMGSLLSDMQRDFENLFGSGFPWPLSLRRSVASSNGWVPQVDIFEKDGKLILKAELPGVAKSDVDVSMDDHNLVIRGERKSENEVKEDQYYRMERSFGSFYRSIPVPRHIKPEDVSARFEDGVLTVTMNGVADGKASATTVPVE